MPVPSDTSPDAERILSEGYRRMSPAEKLERVVARDVATRAASPSRPWPPC